MAESLDVTNLPEGTLLADKYRAVATIGVGGMGAVVACDHLTLGQPVALKFLLPSLLAVPGITQRFLREAKASTRLDSEHVVKVLDVGTLPDGLPFMVMELLEGEDLAQLVDAGRQFTVEEAIDFVVQAGEALGQAHRLGIVHRDIKPANLFLVERGEQWPLVKVLDFGVSKVLDEDGGPSGALTKTTTVIGSGSYMSPEQIRSAKKVDHRTDIYALGVSLYELLAHAVPFEAEGFAELTLKICSEPPAPLKKHRPELPDALVSVIERSIARGLDQRYQSIASFVVALAPFAAPQTLPLIEQIAQAAGEPFTPPGSDDESPFSKTQALDPSMLVWPTTKATAARETARAKLAAPFVPLDQTLVMDSEAEAAAAAVVAALPLPAPGPAKAPAPAAAPAPTPSAATMLLDVEAPKPAPGADGRPEPKKASTPAAGDRPAMRGATTITSPRPPSADSPWSAKAEPRSSKRPPPTAARRGLITWIVIGTVLVLGLVAVVAALLLAP